MYKPIFKVAYKTVTELEWRCCPGFSGYGCMEAAYHHPGRMMPPFTGPSYKGQMFKGPQLKGPQHKGPIFKGPVVKGPVVKGPMFKGPMFKGPMFKGPMFKGPPMKANPWGQLKGFPPGGYPMHHFDPPMAPSYPETTSFEAYPSGPEALPDHQGPHQGEHEPEPEPEHETQPETELEHGLGHGHGHGHAPEQHVSVETAPTDEGLEVEGKTEGQLCYKECKEGS